MKEYFVYIVECADKSYYTGITNDCKRRIYEHNLGNKIDSYTCSRRPVKLVYVEVFNRPMAAIKREKQIKGWSRNKKKALIDNNKVDLIKYSQRYTLNKKRLKS